MKRMPVNCLKCVRIYFQVHTLTRISHIIYIFPNDHRMFTLKRTLEISQWCSSLAPSETMGGLVKTQLQRISSIDDRWKIDRGRVKIV